MPIYPFLAIMIFAGIDGCLHEFVDMTDREMYSTVVQILHFALQTIAVIVLATAGWTKDLVLIGIAQAYMGLVMMVANYAIVLYKGWLDDYRGGLATILSLKVSVDRVFGPIPPMPFILKIICPSCTGSTGSAHHDDHSYSNRYFLVANLWRSKNLLIVYLQCCQSCSHEVLLLRDGSRCSIFTAGSNDGICRVRRILCGTGEFAF
jgi:hypothetical protein